ncbi:unnamed protein product [Ranitomeya imitator]|uniref:E3 ubiquitin ligase UBR4 C-terminal domain-containing protein n=1 Tax=Ranitomeya imitator TaxID=111125 RepID=A0ABN9M194_9NEOB|nr:unnamed protein product [Ranitomeya imitator]
MPGKPVQQSKRARNRPLMRDIKNKICPGLRPRGPGWRDRLRHELLVNKTRSIQPGPAGGRGVQEGVELRLMRGTNENNLQIGVFLGDATEESLVLDFHHSEEERRGEVSTMAGGDAQCGGLECMLNRLAGIKDFKQDAISLRSSKAFQLLLKVKVNRTAGEARNEHSNVMLGTLNLVSPDNSPPIHELSANPDIEAFGQTSGNLLLNRDKDQLVMLLDQINSTFVRSNPSVLQGLLRISPLPVVWRDGKRCRSWWIASSRTALFRSRTTSIAPMTRFSLTVSVRSPPALRITEMATLKDLILQKGITQKRPGLHEETHPQCQEQALIGTDSITNLHKLEQVSSDEGIGTLAKTLLEALQAPRRQKEDRRSPEGDSGREEAYGHGQRQKALGTLGMT